MSRRTKVDNRTEGMLEIKVFQELSERGNYVDEIQVASGCRRDISASAFKNRNKHYFLASEVVIFVNGIEFEKSLVPETFTDYSQVIFELEGHLLKVMGVPAKQFDLSRIRGFRFLDRSCGDKEAKLIFFTKPLHRIKLSPQ